MEKYQDDPEAVLVYSMWDGYLDGRDQRLTEFVKPFEDAGRMTPQVMLPLKTFKN